EPTHPHHTGPAETHLRQALALARRWGSAWQVAEVLLALSATTSDPAPAEEALAISRTTGLRPLHPHLTP
uniref:hypothetical protein n=1 Tax=Saccharothrix syringae TaxID=103733 RepID=UPI001476DFFD